jgi:hypothetical protein
VADPKDRNSFRMKSPPGSGKEGILIGIKKENKTSHNKIPQARPEILSLTFTATTISFKKKMK